MNIKHQQTEEAIGYCKTGNVRGWAALKTGHFPLIKDFQTIYSYQDRFVKNDSDEECNSILTMEEELIQIDQNIKVSTTEKSVLISKMFFEITHIIFKILANLQFLCQ